MRRIPRQQWKRHVAAWRESGLSGREFATRIGVNARTLAYWKWRLASTTDEASIEAAPFVEVSGAVVSSVNACEEDRIEVLCRGGRLVRVGRDFDAATLVRLLDALETR